EEKCAERDVPPYLQNGDFDSESEDVSVNVKFYSSVIWRVVDDQGAERPKFEDDGSCILTFSWSDRPSLYEYLLGFGAHAEIIEPRQFRQEFKELVKSISDKYKE
ncbi:MAG: WYL domain-containing protein, partial [Ruminiclostridium sp.]|nr:WYL domain-containing protein [Ruminiclostridium sp.]